MGTITSASVSNNKNGIVVNESYVEPARPKKPQDKGMVEQGVQAIQRWILAALRDRTFFSVDELNDAIATLLDKYNNKVIKRLGKSRTQLFEENDKPYLQTLPSNRFVYKEFKIATVNIDYHVELHKCFYFT